ncbi:YitT family protein [uncultured Granulicatella sp.]|uniref:YitT family protein n=1 Tax=uncultured Granulicatella sp. TaxID=316089 RepID=UPI0028D094B1|nr:YitT family protein [uncultured Granulicatella sp.]
MKKYINQDTLTSILMVTIGSFIFSFTINAVVIPNQFGSGGVTGITLLLYYILGINPGTSNLVINIVLLLIGYQFLERRTMFYNIYDVILMSVFLDITRGMYQFIPHNSLLAAIGGGVVGGAALGLVMLGNGTTAGTDIIAMMLKKYLGWNVSVSLLLLDIFVVSPLSIISDLEKVVITLIYLFTASRMINLVLEGFNSKKSFMIISKKYEEIGSQIQEKIGRGTTILDGHGFYSREERKVLFVAVNRLQVMTLQRIIHDVDPKAFIIITEVTHVIGEGFTYQPKS